jgi:hypothetical protein
VAAQVAQSLRQSSGATRPDSISVRAMTASAVAVPVAAAISSSGQPGGGTMVRAATRRSQVSVDSGCASRAV